MPSSSTLILTSGLILFGTITSLFSKIIYQLKGDGRDGHVHNFEKPWASTALMFISMALALPYSYLDEYLCKRKRRGHDEVTDPLLEKQPRRASTFRDKAVIAIPMMFDLVATALMSIGLLFVTASVYQILRGSEMLFCALYSVAILRRPLNKFHYLGLAGAVVGISLVGASTLLEGGVSEGDGGAATNLALGMSLIVLSQAVQAGQLTLEDVFMHDNSITPLRMVGYEGLYGAVVVLGLILPIVQWLPGADGTGVHEDSIDTIQLLLHTPSIVYVALALSVSQVMYNIMGMYITEQLGSVSRSVLECLRTLFVWLADLALFYQPWRASHTLGEAWTQWSWLQAIGFAVVVAATLLYGHGDQMDEEKHIKEWQKEAPGRPLPVFRAKTFKVPYSMHATANMLLAVRRMRARARWTNAIDAVNGGSSGRRPRSLYQLDRDYLQNHDGQQQEGDAERQPLQQQYSRPEVVV